ncbi:MAG: DeoR family transcriptional regulator [Boseongicola sp.]|nr:MAG: DeoR family transcriptional regulator [Boseongicola sp.]
MPENIRLGQILDLVRRDGKVTTDSLAQTFDVTVQTARRDLAALCDTGQLTRVYGGAVLPSGTRNIGHHDRQTLHAEAKTAMAQLIAARIPNGASVFLDIGTTLESVAEALRNHQNLMVITNNLHVGNILAYAPGIDVILTGGLLRPADGGLVGEVTAEFVQQFRPDYALLGASALSADGDALDFDFREVRVAQAVKKRAHQSILMADSSKFTRSAPVCIAQIADFNTFVTDAQPPDTVQSACRETGCKILTP